MFYRVVTVLNFTEEDDAKDFVHDCRLAQSKSMTINPGKLNEEKGMIQYQRCYHDETPNKQCKSISTEYTP